MYSGLYRSSWLHKDADEVSEAIRAAILKQEQLDAAISTLRSSIATSSEPSTAGLDETLVQLEDSAATIREFVGSIAQPEFYNERHSTAPNRASDVLELSELLEMILSHLPVHDILQMQRVSKPCLESIQQSPRIQRKLGHSSDTDTALHVTLDASPLTEPYFDSAHDSIFSCSATPSRHWLRLSYGDNAEAEADDTADFYAHFRTNVSGKLPVIGGRYRSMTICQPANTQLRAYADCCAYAVSRAPNPAAAAIAPPEMGGIDVQSEDGLTIGDLYDVAQKFRQGTPHVPRHRAIHA